MLFGQKARGLMEMTLAEAQSICEDRNHMYFGRDEERELNCYGCPIYNICSEMPYDWNLLAGFAPDEEALDKLATEVEQKWADEDAYKRCFTDAPEELTFDQMLEESLKKIEAECCAASKPITDTNRAIKGKPIVAPLDRIEICEEN